MLMLLDARMPLAILFDCGVFYLLFRSLTSPTQKLSVNVRLAIGVAVVFAVTLAYLWVDCSAWALLPTTVGLVVASAVIPGAGLSQITAALGRFRFPLYALAMLTTAALVFLFVPITTYLTSPGELSIQLNHLATTNARAAMVIVYVAVALYAITISSRMRTVLTLLAVGAMAITIIYSYVLPFGYPIMSGLMFEQIPLEGRTVLWRTLGDFAVVIAVALATRAVLLRFGAKPVMVGILLVNASLVGAATVNVMRDRIGEAGDDPASAALAERPLRFSKDHPNVLIVFLDRFMGSYVESILKSDPTIAAQLSGFTWYPRTVSAGENTIAGFHPLMGGYDYLPVEMNARGKPLRDLSVEAYSILPYNFSKHQYHVNIVGPRGLGFTMAGDCKLLQIENVSCTRVRADVAEKKAREMEFPIEALSQANYTDLLVMLASMRSLPYAAKQIVFARGPWRPFLDHSAGTTFKQWAELNALDQLTAVGAPESNFNYVSNILAHEPYYLGENCIPQREQFKVPDEEVARRGHVSLFSLQHSNAARCALLAVANYMDFLKRSGVYDNTKILIVSDHGIVGPVEDDSTRAIAGGTQDAAYVRVRPLMLVKPIAAQGPMRISEEFMPNAETPRIVCEDIGGCVNPYLNDRPIRADGRDDPFRVSIVPWQFSAQHPSAYVIEEQLELRNKDPFDARGWVGIVPWGNRVASTSKDGH